MYERDSILVSVPGTFTSKPNKPSCWRRWKQLSRLQRSLIMILLFIGATAFAAYFLQVDSRSVPNAWAPQEKPPSHLERSGQHADGDVGAEPQVRFRPIKRGPPAHRSKVALGDNQMKGEKPNLALPELREIDIRWRGSLIGISKAPNLQGEEVAVKGGDKPVVGTLKAKVKNQRQQAVVEAFRHAWLGYRRFAWGRDELRPVSQGYKEWFGLGLTLLDALDTMWIMGLQEEFEEARKWVASELNFNKNVDVNLFECTIRILGGLLSTFHLTGDKLFLDKATDLGVRLLPAFGTPSHIPYSDVNLGKGTAHGPKWTSDSTVAEVTSIQLEFRELSWLTGDERFREAAEAVTRHVRDLAGKTDGLVPMFISTQTGHFTHSNTLTLGARADSYYEYLLKQWLQGGKREQLLLDSYLEAISGVQKHLLGKSQPNQLTFVGELVNGELRPKMDHLVCFLPGTLALGTRHGLDPSHLQLAEKLANTCYQMYRQTETGLSAEISYFNTQSDAKQDISIKPADKHNLLRPETVESLFYLYWITGNHKYQDWGWDILQSINLHTKVPSGGYTSIANVCSRDNPQPRDKMESFFLSETLKYLYLLFSDNLTLISPDTHVFNTEAHPLPIHTEP
uniref:endoplasmic reticulum mannosyl-oligosaccharide 1,2-alpha-mannosidase isoform X1 n=2 Tax=Myxine glutinosa TaxID=7769 RepID=UPI00358FB743